MPDLRPRRPRPSVTKHHDVGLRLLNIDDVIDVLWDDRQQVFRGTVSKYNARSGKFLVHYFDGDVLWQNLNELFWRKVGENEWFAPFSAVCTPANFEKPRKKTRVRKRSKPRSVVSAPLSNPSMQPSENNASEQRIQQEKTQLPYEPKHVSEHDTERVLDEIATEPVFSSQQTKTAASSLESTLQQSPQPGCTAVSDKTILPPVAVHDLTTELSFSGFMSPTTVASPRSHPQTPLSLPKAMSVVPKEDSQKRRFEFLELRCIPPRKRFCAKTWTNFRKEHDHFK